MQNILIIDDDVTVCEILSRILASINVNPLTVTSGQEASDYIANNIDKIDAIVLDLILPNGHTGWTLLDELEDLKEKKPPILIMTGAPLSTEEKLKLEERSDYLMMKNTFSVDSFINAISKIIKVNK